MELTAIHLKFETVTKESVELVTGIRFEKSIEQTWFGKNDVGYVYMSRFNTVCFIGFDNAQIISFLRAMQVPNAQNYKSHYLHQDYKIKVDESIDKPFVATNNEVVIKEQSESLISIIAIVASQSVGLEKFEQLLDENMPKSRMMLNDQAGFVIFKRKKLLKFAAFLANIRQDMIMDLLLLDKPNITWDDEVAESLYNKLSDVFDLRERLTQTEYKLSLIRDNIAFLMDTLNHQNSEILEWIIIILIAFEIGMSLYRI